MTKIGLKTEYISRIGTFRPSDRAFLASAFSDAANGEIALEALKEFVREWEKADWLEAYSLERIGKWLGKENAAAAGAIISWAKSKKTEARSALLKGIEVHLPKEQLVA